MTMMEMTRLEMASAKSDNNFIVCISLSVSQQQSSKILRKGAKI